jgi:hypothetical protein
MARLDISNALISAQDIVDDRHVEGDVGERCFRFQYYFGVIAHKLGEIFREGTDDSSRKETSVTHMTAHLAKIKTPQELKNSLALVIRHLNSFDDVALKLEHAHQRILELISTGQGEIIYELTHQGKTPDEADARGMERVGEKIRLAQEAIHDRSEIMTLRDSLSHIERLLKEARDEYLEFYKKYKAPTIS